MLSNQAILQALVHIVKSGVLCNIKKVIQISWLVPNKILQMDWKAPVDVVKKINCSKSKKTHFSIQF